MQHTQLAPRQLTQNASASQQLTQRASPADAATPTTTSTKQLIYFITHSIHINLPHTHCSRACCCQANQYVAQGGEIECEPLIAGTQQQLHHDPATAAPTGCRTAYTTHFSCHRAFFTNRYSSTTDCTMFSPTVCCIQVCSCSSTTAS